MVDYARRLARDQTMNSREAPHSSPVRASYGVSIVIILEEIDCAIMGPSHWKQRLLMMPTLSSVMAPLSLIMTNYAISDDKVGIMTTLGFRGLYCYIFSGFMVGYARNLGVVQACGRSAVHWPSVSRAWALSPSRSHQLPPWTRKKQRSSGSMRSDARSRIQTIMQNRSHCLTPGSGP